MKALHPPGRKKNGGKESDSSVLTGEMAEGIRTATQGLVKDRAVQFLSYQAQRCPLGTCPCIQLLYGLQLRQDSEIWFPFAQGCFMSPVKWHVGSFLCVDSPLPEDLLTIESPAVTEANASYIFLSSYKTLMYFYIYQSSLGQWVFTAQTHSFSLKLVFVSYKSLLTTEYYTGNILIGAVSVPWPPHNSFLNIFHYRLCHQL